jgi:hypothetical protein
MLHVDLQFAILAPRVYIPRILSPLLHSNCPDPWLLPPSFPSPAPVTSPDLRGGLVSPDSDLRSRLEDFGGALSAELAGSFRSPPAWRWSRGR